MLCWTCIFVFLLIAGLWYYYDVYSRKEKITDITKKCVFITGCDSGFGMALAERLDELGMVVFAGCLTEKGAKDVRQKASRNLHTVLVDVTSTESIEKAYQFVKNKLPKGKVLWGVVNNAGWNGPGGPLEFGKREDYERVFQVNLFGPAEVMRVFLPLLKHSQGRIVNMASIAGILAITMNHAYVSSKYAMVGISDAVRREKHAWGIKVSTLEPGFFRTALFEFDVWKKMKEQQWKDQTPEVQQEFGEQFLQKALDQRRRMTGFTTPDLSPVVNAYEHALTSVNPREHYLCGWDAKMFAVVAMLPAVFSDLYVRWKLKMPLPDSLK